MTEPDRLFADPELAALYDSLCPRASRADFDFYLSLIMAAGSVLDAGCGTGALLHEARQAGHTGRLVGLDPGEGMLAQARANATIEWVLGDLASATPQGPFDLVVMTGHAFQVLIADADIRAALTAIRAVLAPTGCFAFETRNPAARAWEAWTPDHPIEFDHQGISVRMTRRIEAPFDGETVAFSHRFNSAAWTKARMSHSRLRFLDSASLEHLLKSTGLAVKTLFGDWDGRPFTDECPEIILLVGRSNPDPPSEPWNKD